MQKDFKKIEVDARSMEYGDMHARIQAIRSKKKKGIDKVGRTISITKSNDRNIERVRHK